jgi:hypothetical protein
MHNPSPFHIADPLLGERVILSLAVTTPLGIVAMLLDGDLVRLPAATGYVGTVAAINALTRPVGVMAFATNASGGPKPCWSTGSAWVLADGSALS